MKSNREITHTYLCECWWSWKSSLLRNSREQTSQMNGLSMAWNECMCSWSFARYWNVLSQSLHLCGFSLWYRPCILRCARVENNFPQPSASHAKFFGQTWVWWKAILCNLKEWEEFKRLPHSSHMCGIFRLWINDSLKFLSLRCRDSDILAANFTKQYVHFHLRLTFLVGLSGNRPWTVSKCRRSVISSMKIFWHLQHWWSCCSCNTPVHFEVCRLIWILSKPPCRHFVHWCSLVSSLMPKCTDLMCRFNPIFVTVLRPHRSQVYLKIGRRN